MKELQYPGGQLIVEDAVADAIGDLASALGDTGMSALIELHAADEAAAIRIEIGRDHRSGRNHVLHARPSRGEGSHLGLDDL
jgi:hypothetical protein